MSQKLSKKLYLTLQKKWFDMISDPNPETRKDEEYRKDSDWIRSRLFTKEGTPRQYKWVYFKNGYRVDSPIIIREFKGVDFGTGKPEWGAKPNEHYHIIKMGEILTEIKSTIP